MAVEAKVCGLTNLGDAVVAVEAGASYLGVVFASGPRLVTLPMAREIVVAGSGCPVFGVFGAHSAGEILRVRDETGITGAQLHTTVRRETAERLRDEGMLVWAVARISGAADLTGLEDLAHVADAVLVEAAVPGIDGGAGVPLDIDLARRARERLPGRMVLAGGLRPETVTAVISAIGPDVVDVSSGVESAPGRKDPVRMRLFLEAVRGNQPSP